jgi:hypothetical protein
MAVLLDPSGTNERVSFSFEGSDICGNFKYGISFYYVRSISILHDY